MATCSGHLWAVEMAGPGKEGWLDGRFPPTPARAQTAGGARGSTTGHIASTPLMPHLLSTSLPWRALALTV